MDKNKDITEFISKLDQLRETEETEGKPNWIITDENGKDHIAAIPLAKHLEEKHQYTFSQFSEHGYWFDTDNCQWKKRADQAVQVDVKNAMLEVQKWNTGIHSSVCKLIELDSRDLGEKDPFASPAPHKAVFRRKTYDLMNDTLEESRPENRILQNHDYDLDMDHSAPCWNRLLNESLVIKDSEKAGEHDPKAVETLKTFIGYALIGNYKDFQHYVLLYGPGGDGKSTFLNWLTQIVGVQNTSNVSLEALTNSEKSKFAIAKLYQKSLNVYADISDKFMDQTAMVKTLSGGDRIEAQFKHKDLFEFANEAKLIFSCNSLPSFKDFSDGMFRRPIIIEYHKVNGFKDKYNEADLMNEIPAFAYDCMRIYKKALDSGIFPTTDYMDSVKKKWFADNNKLEMWLIENCDFDSKHVDYKQHEETATLYNNYRTYCQQNGVKPLSKPKFNRMLDQKGIKHNVAIKVNGHVKKGYKGIKRKVKYQTDLN